jgi:nitroimidazol reductase NimA-like FMN-containing flavoprotein (pyridoxamine 5'-phosphate oxidase superfamily)
VADRLIDEGLELLTEPECLRLLGTGEVGRVGLTIGALPAIFPVNYGMVDGSIVFRTAPGSKLAAAALGAIVAFEVDDYDRADRSGWSVLVVGASEIVHDVDVTFRVLDAAIEPWAGGIRTSIVRIRPELVSGRRIV